MSDEDYAKLPEVLPLGGLIRNAHPLDEEVHAVANAARRGDRRAWLECALMLGFMVMNDDGEYVTVDRAPQNTL